PDRANAAPRRTGASPAPRPCPSSPVWSVSGFEPASAAIKRSPQREIFFCRAHAMTVIAGAASATASADPYAETRAMRDEEGGWMERSPAPLGVGDLALGSI